MLRSVRIKVVAALSLIVLCLLQHEGYGQEKTTLTQYMFNGLAINPAYAGSQNVLNATAWYRNQWVGVPGAPNTQTFSIHSALKKKRIGLGLLVMNDQIGVHNDLNVYGVYAYKIKLSRKSILSMGIQGGFNNLISKYDELNLKHPNDLSFIGDSKFSPNVGTGLYYYLANRAYVGFSIPYIIKTRVLPKELNGLGKQARYYYLTGGYVFDINENLKMKPSALIRMEEGAPLGFDINANLIIKEIIFFGLSYRSTDAASALLQLQLTPRWQLGYGYDFTTSALNRFSSGSHEIMLNYRINLFPEKCATYL